MADTLTLHEITEELRALQDALIESGGEITDEMEEGFDALLEMEEDKTDGYIAVIRSLEEEAEALKREEKRLKKRRKARESSADSMKERLRMAMDIRGEEKREATLGTLRVQTASRRSVVIDVDEEELPEEFIRVRRSADKKAIREWMEEMHIERVTAGETQLAHLDEPTRYLRIY